jgi:uncharacterized protein
MDFRSLIKEQREELQDIEKREQIVLRVGFQNAKLFLKHPNILAVVGVRRCGKSIFSYLLAKEHSFGYINFDDERLVGVKTEDLNRILEAFYSLYGDVEYIVLDEVQNVEKWELFVNRLRRTKKVIVTGSNSKLLAGELATHLTGRYIDLTLFPFSFREYLLLKHVEIPKNPTTKEKAEILSRLEDYIQQGGFPEVDKFGSVMAAKIYHDIISKDILLRYGTKKKETLKQLAHYLITNFATEHSYRKLSRHLDIRHVSTVSNWVSYLVHAFLLVKLERFSVSLKKQFIAPKKIYCIDQGIIHMMGHHFSENKGRHMENLVAIELQRRKAEDHLLDVYYWKDYQHHEVDFVCKRGTTVQQLLQVHFANEKKDIKDRELVSLNKAGKELHCKNLKVITWDYEATIQGVSFVPLWKWLLESKSI